MSRNTQNLAQSKCSVSIIYDNSHYSRQTLQAEPTAHPAQFVQEASCLPSSGQPWPLGVGPSPGPAATPQVSLPERWSQHTGLF